MIDEVKKRYQEGLAILRACRSVAFDAMDTDPGNVQLTTLHDHFKDAELSFLKAQEIMIRLEKQEQGKEPS
jgi:hypothetical protein